MLLVLMNYAQIKGDIARIVHRGRHVCFEGANLQKIGSGELTHAAFGDRRFIGELIAIGPTRAILHLSNILPEPQAIHAVVA